MTAYTLLKPQLYSTVAGAAAKPGEACVLSGGRCQCGHIFFPMQSYGCENCGALGEALEATELAGSGRLVAAAKVHVHKSESRQAPFIVASVELDAGPLVRTLLDWPLDQEPPVPGTRMTAVLLRVEGGCDDVLDLRFRPEGACSDTESRP